MQKESTEIIRLNKTDFKKWLETLNPKSIAGHINHGYDCPIANFLRSKNVKNEDVNLSFAFKGGIRIDCRQNKAIDNKYLPQWCSNFCYKVIETNRKSTTAKKCLDILDKI